jgi:hypothetical protein
MRLGCLRLLCYACIPVSGSVLGKIYYSQPYGSGGGAAVCRNPHGVEQGMVCAEVCLICMDINSVPALRQFFPVRAHWLVQATQVCAVALL